MSQSGYQLRNIKAFRTKNCRRKMAGFLKEVTIKSSCAVAAMLLQLVLPSQSDAQIPDGYFDIDPLTCSLTPEFPDNDNFRIKHDKTLPKDVPVFSNALVIDLDGNGSPEIITLGSGGFDANVSPRSARNVEIFNGQTGAHIRTINTPFLNYEGAMPVALADLDGDGDVEIVVATSHIEKRAPDLISPGHDGNSVAEQSILIIYDHLGNEIARSDTNYGKYTPVDLACGHPDARQMASGAAPGIADFNNDGRPEIYIYNEIFNDKLVKLVDGGHNGIGLGHSNRNGGAMALSVAANFDGEPNLELAAGNTLYNVSISNPNGAGGNTMTPTVFSSNLHGGPARDGFTSIADIDLDGEFDIVVTTERVTTLDVKEYPCKTIKPRYVYAWNPRSNSLIASAQLEQVEQVILGKLNDPFSQGGTGVAFIGDVNSNGNPNIGVTSPLNVEMFEYVIGNTTLKRLWKLGTSDKSGMTMITMFDFNQDGVQELVYRDESDLRIINGNLANPNTLASIPVESATSLEGPTIADVDNDGEAEILVVNSNYDKGDPFHPDDVFELGVYFDLTGKIEIFKSADLPWAPARGVWNQYAYHNINIQDNRQVPQFMPKPSDLDFDDPCNGDIAFKRPLNNFLVQSTFFDSNGCPTVNIGAIDATIEIVEAKYTCTPGEIEVKYIVNNISPDEEIPPGLKVSFFEATIDPANQLSITSGGTTTQLIGRESSSNTLTAIVKGATEDPYPNTITLVGLVNSDGTPNFEPIPECDYTNNDDEIEVIPRPVYIVVNDQGDICQDEIISLLPENQIQNSVTSNLSWYQVNGSGHSLIENNTNLNGAIHLIDPDTYELSISSLSPGNYTYQLEIECTGQLVDVNFEVFPSPTPQYDIKHVLCKGESTGELHVISGGVSSYRYELIETGAKNESGTFSNLPAGDYTVQVEDMGSQSNCISSINLVIEEPQENIDLTAQVLEDATCNLNNGKASVTVSGGTVASEYQLESLLLKEGGPNTPIASPSVTNSGNSFEFTELQPGAYTVSFMDDNACIATGEFTINNTPVPSIEVKDVLACENEVIILTPQVTQGTAPGTVFEWFTTETGVTPISNGVQDGISYSMDPTSGSLAIEGLGYTGSPKTFYLAYSGPEICASTGRIPAVVSLNLPADPIIINQQDVICYGESDGSIEFGVTNGVISDYEFQLDQGAFQASPMFTDLAAGDYELAVRHKDTGCLSLLPVIIEQPEEIQVKLISHSDPTCGDSNGQIQFEVSGGTSGYKVAINGSPIDGDGFSYEENNGVYTVSQLEPGQYTVGVQDNNSCLQEAVDLIELVNNNGIAIQSDPIEAEACFGAVVELDPQLTLDPSAEPILKWFYDIGANEEITAGIGSTGEKYTIDPQSNRLSVDNLQEGSYTYFLQISGPNICTLITSATATVYPTLQIDLKASDESCFEAKDGTITATAIGGGGEFTYSIDGVNFQTDPVFENLSLGNYEVTVRSTSSCEAVKAITVNGPTSPITVNNPVILRSSCNLPNGSISDLEISGGYGEYTVTWHKGSSLGPVVQGDENGASDLLADRYYLVVKDKTCEEVFDFEVLSQPFPDVVIPSQDVCEGEEVIFTPTNIVSGASSTTYKWYKDASKTQEVIEGVDPLDSSIEYKIDSEGVLIISGLKGQEAYTFYLELVCSGEVKPAEASVNLSPGPVFEVSPEICFGDKDGTISIVSGGSADYEYFINGNGPFTQAQLESDKYAPGNYEIRVARLGLTCDRTFNLTLDGAEQSLKATPLTGVNPGCGALNGKLETQIVGGWPPYNVVLFRNNSVIDTRTISESLYSIDGLDVGAYYLEITDEQGCIVVTDPTTLVPGPTQILIDDAKVCEGESVKLDPILSPVASDYTIKWYKDQALTMEIESDPNPNNGVIYTIASNGTLTIDGLEANPSLFKYYATVSGGTVCPGFVAVADVEVSSVPSGDYSSTGIVCYGDMGIISLSGSGGNGSYSYSLDGVNFQNESNFSVPAGSYKGYILSGGCVYTTPPILVEGPVLPLEMTNLASEAPTCNQDNGQISFEIVPEYEDYQVIVRKNGVDYSTQTQPNGKFIFHNLEEGEYEFNVIGKNQWGTCAMPVFNYKLEPAESPINVFDDRICFGETGQLVPDYLASGVSPVYRWFSDPNGNNELLNGSSSDGVTYMISPEGILDVSGLADRLEPYTYYLSVSGPGTCVPELVEASIYVQPMASLRVSNPSIVCDPNGFVDLTQFIEGFDVGIFDYEVYSPQGVSPMRVDDLNNVNESGFYRVKNKYKGTACWTPEQRILVSISDTELAPDFQYQADLGGGLLVSNGKAQILEDIKFEDLSIGKVISWSWNFGDGTSSTDQNPTHQYQEKGVFTVTLTTVDEFGCVAEIQKVIEVIDDYDIIIPNAFTPTGVKNNYFKPKFRGIVTMEFYIFSTWGELIYETDQVEDPGWDGLVNGKPAIPGNYVYKGVFKSKSGERVEKAGTFVLIR